MFIIILELKLIIIITLRSTCMYVHVCMYMYVSINVIMARNFFGSERTLVYILAV